MTKMKTQPREKAEGGGGAARGGRWRRGRGETRMGGAVVGGGDAPAAATRGGEHEVRFGEGNTMAGSGRHGGDRNSSATVASGGEERSAVAVQHRGGERGKRGGNEGGTSGTCHDATSGQEHHWSKRSTTGRHDWLWRRKRKSVGGVLSREIGVEKGKGRKTERHDCLS